MPLQLAIKPNPAQALNAYNSTKKLVRPGVKLSALLGTNPENQKCALKWLPTSKSECLEYSERATRASESASGRSRQQRRKEEGKGKRKKGGIRTFWSRKGLFQKMNPKITRRQGFPKSGDIKKTQRRSLNIRKRNMVSSFGLLLEKRKAVRVCSVSVLVCYLRRTQRGAGELSKMPISKICILI